MAKLTPEAFATTLQSARAGSREDLGRLLQLLHQRLWMLSKTILPAPLLAKIDLGELNQETLASIVNDFADFRGQTEPEFFLWARTILHRRAMKLARRDSKTQKRGTVRPLSLHDEYNDGILADLIADDEATPYTSTNRKERKDLLMRAAARLKPEYQEVVEWHFRKGKSFSETAAILGKSAAAVEKTWRRALHAWKQALMELGLVEES